MFKDTVLHWSPGLMVANFLRRKVQEGGRITAAKNKKTGKMQYFVAGCDVPLDGDEVSWMLRRGYIRSELVGRTVTVTIGEYSVEEFIKPDVVYYITEKGRKSSVWE